MRLDQVRRPSEPWAAPGAARPARRTTRVIAPALTSSLALAFALLPGVVSAQWDQLGLDIDGEAAADNSGTSVALSSDGSRLAVGAPRNHGVDGSASGHVRVWEWNGSSWVQCGSDIDGEAPLDVSGSSVALSSDGSRVAIGAPHSSGNGERSGQVRVFTDMIFADGFESGGCSAWSSAQPLCQQPRCRGHELPLRDAPARGPLAATKGWRCRTSCGALVRFIEG
jgi:hypothetical protein